jgi:hypothetical protein
MRLPCLGGRCTTRAVLGNDKREWWRMCTSVARGFPLSLEVRYRTRVAVAARRQLFQTNVSRQSAMCNGLATLATALRGMQLADGMTATGTIAIAIAMWAEAGQWRHVNRQFCMGRDATPRHATPRARVEATADSLRGDDGRWSRGSRGSRWRRMGWTGVGAKRRKGRRSVWWAGWQDGRIEGARRPEGERIKRRGGSKASKRDWTWYVSWRAAGRVSTVPGWSMGGMEAWRHGRVEGRWKRVGAVQSRRLHGAHPRHSFKAVEGEHGRLLGS